MKFQHLETQRDQQSKQYEDEIQRLQACVENLQIHNEGDSNAKHLENERLRMENMEFERKNQDLVNTYDKDKALWDGKFEFLEKQRDQAKDDFSEA